MPHAAKKPGALKPGKPADNKKRPPGKHNPPPVHKPPDHTPVHATPVAHPASTPSGGYANQGSPAAIQQEYVRIGLDLHAPELAILGALCAGLGETPNWDVNLCNYYSGCRKPGYECAGGCCGVWQLDCVWQAQHDYHDVTYWTNYAYKNGFYSHGGLIHIAQANSHLSPGWVAQLCQGAGPTDAAAAAYYEKYESAARAIYAKYASSPATPTGPTVTLKNPWANATVTQFGVDQGCDFAGTGFFDCFAACVVTHYWPAPVWPGNGFLEYQITADGPWHNDYFYIAEHMTPVVRVGEHLPAGAHLAQLQPNAGVEVGQSSGADDAESWARHFGGGWTQARDNARWASRAGLAFANLIATLGGPQAKAANPANVYGDWPRWMPNGVPPGALVQQGAITGPAGGQSGSTTGSTGTTISRAADAVAAQLTFGPFIDHDWWLFRQGTSKGHDSAAAAWKFVSQFSKLTSKQT